MLKLLLSFLLDYRSDAYIILPEYARDFREDPGSVQSVKSKIVFCLICFKILLMKILIKGITVFVVIGFACYLKRNISYIADNRAGYPDSQIPTYDKLEITFQVDNTVAGNFQLPYDPIPPKGIDPAKYPKHKPLCNPPAVHVPQARHDQRENHIRCGLPSILGIYFFSHLLSPGFSPQSCTENDNDSDKTNYSRGQCQACLGPEMTG